MSYFACGKAIFRSQLSFRKLRTLKERTAIDFGDFGVNLTSKINEISSNNMNILDSDDMRSRK